MVFHDIDSMYHALGNPGRYHVIMYLLLCLNYIPVALNHLAMAFYGAKVGHHCKIPESASLNGSIPYIRDKTGKFGYDTCSAYFNFTKASNQTVGCPSGWSYALLPDESTIVSEFDLVCEKKDLSALATTIYFVGVMAGGLIFGTISDFFGRRRTVIFCMVAHVPAGISLYFVQSYVAFVIVRFIQGVIMQGFQTSNFVLIMELFRKEHRSAAGLIIELYWAGGVMLLAMIAYLARSWRNIQLCITAPFALFWAFAWFVPESPRWLKDKDPQGVKKFFLRAAKVNNIEPKADMLNLNGEDRVNDNEGRKYNILDLVRTPKLRKRSFVTFYISMVTAIGYYGILYSITGLSGNKYLSFFIGGFIELPAYCMTVWIVGRFGRRLPLFTYFVGGGLFCISAGVVNKLEVDVPYLATGLALSGRFLMACCFAVLPLFVSELYPTMIRNVGLGVSYFWIRLGGVLFSPLLLLGEYTFSALPFILFGILSVIGGFVTLLLPETLNIKMPDTIEEAEGMRYQHDSEEENANKASVQNNAESQDTHL